MVVPIGVGIIVVVVVVGHIIILMKTTQTRRILVVVIIIVTKFGIVVRRFFVISLVGIRGGFGSGIGANVSSFLHARGWTVNIVVVVVDIISGAATAKQNGGQSAPPTKMWPAEDRQGRFHIASFFLNFVSLQVLRVSRRRFLASSVGFSSREKKILQYPYQTIKNHGKKFHETGRKLFRMV